MPSSEVGRDRLKGRKSHSEWPKKRRIAMFIRKNVAEIAAVAFAMMLVGGTAVAQGAFPGQKRATGRKPIVQAKPNTPIGCKLVGTVRGTKIWAGDCVGASEIRGATPAEELSSPPSAAAPTEKQ